MANYRSSVILKNTTYLYIRTIVVMFVMLYTSRVILQALGVEDLGIYNVVGGIVALFTFVQQSLTKATSRFITYDLGNSENVEKVQRTFSLSMTIHLCLAVSIFIICEIVGPYMLNNWTSIPEDRHVASLYVFHLALILFCVHIIRVPYDSIIIAHEQMSVYAYMSIVEAMLQLFLALFLLFYPGDKLILYSFLMLAIGIILFICYYYYVRKKYSQYKFHFVWDKNYGLKILSFSGWTLLGSSTMVLSEQGISLFFNNFIGLVANAALGFTNQINSAVKRLVGNFTTAFNPQIIKLIAQHDYENLYSLINKSSKFSFLLIWFICLPLITNIDFVLDIWLDKVPEYTADFCRMILICSVIDATTTVYNISITGNGQIKNYQLFISMSFILDTIFSYCLLKNGFEPKIVFGSRILTRGFLNMFIGWYFMHKLLMVDIKKYIKQVLLPVLLTITLSLIPVLFVCLIFNGISCLIISIFTSLIITSLCCYFIIMNNDERQSSRHMLDKILSNLLQYKK